MKVFVLDKNKKPLMPMAAARARALLKDGRAIVVKRLPFTIRLKDRQVEQSQVQPVRLKFDPGSRTTGIALLREDGPAGEVLHLAELHHQRTISSKLQDRRAFRRRRRTQNIRHRGPRFKNRTRPKGWLPPSLRSRVDNITSWAGRYCGLVPLATVSVETVKFDTQKMQNPEIDGVEYQQGELQGYEVREYLLEKWGRQCAYCDARDIPLQVEHIHPRSRSGSNRVSNLTLACRPCNMAKGNQPVELFLKDDPVRLAQIKRGAKKPLKDAAAVTATRWAIWRELSEMGLPVEVGTGARTKYNRSLRRLPKTHAFDAACVGASTPTQLKQTRQSVLSIRAAGRGRYQRTTINKYGFPVGFLKRQKCANGIKTGDLVAANILTGKGAGRYVGHAVIRHTGQFKVKVGGKVVAQGHRKYFRLLERSAGYELELIV